MKKTIKAALTGITTATAGFLKKRGIYVVALALISAAALSAVLTVKQPNGADPAQTDDPASEVNTDIGDRLTDAQLPIATPTPSPTATPTPMPDFTPAPPTPKPTAVQKLSPPVRGEVIWGFAVNELIYSRTLDQWTTHTGVDVAAPKGSGVYAVFAGTVTEIFTDDSLGVMVEVKGANDMIAVYGNLKAEPPVKVGARINAGDIVGYVGDTAVSECGDKSHVHFELLKDEKYVDPQSYVLFVRQPPVKGSLLVRFTSLYDGPTLKGEVGFAKQKPEGLKKERSFACYRQPLRRLISTLYLCTDGWAYFSSYFLAYSAKSAL